GVMHARIGPDGATAAALFGDLQNQPSPGVPQQGLGTYYLAQWDLGQGRLLTRHTTPLTQARNSAVAPGGRLLVSRGTLIDPASGQELRRLEGVDPELLDMAVSYVFSADGLLVAGGSARRVGEGDQKAIGPDGARVWESATGKRIASLQTASWIG